VILAGRLYVLGGPRLLESPTTDGAKMVDQEDAKVTQMMDLEEAKAANGRCCWFSLPQREGIHCKFGPKVCAAPLPKLGSYV
jgi:hypothetical protein